MPKKSKRSLADKTAHARKKKRKVSHDVEERINKLNSKRTAHQKAFQDEMKLLCSDQKIKMNMKKGGRVGGFFSKYRYDKIVSTMKLDEKIKSATTFGKKYVAMKEELNAVSYVWSQFKLKDNKLYRPSKAGIKRCGGTIKNLDRAAMTEDEDWDEVICIEDKRTFKMINDCHWDDNPKKHKRSNQLHLKVSSKYGSNFTDDICKILFKHCPVCKEKALISKKKKSKNPISLGEDICKNVNSIEASVVFTVFGSEENLEDAVYDTEYFIVIILFEHNQFLNVSIMNEDSYHELSNIMNQIFSTVGYPSTIRYVQNEKDPINFLKHCEYVRKGRICDELIAEAEKQFPMVKLNMKKARKETGVPELLRQATYFCQSFIHDFLKNTIPLGLAVEDWIPRINRYINDHESFFVHKKNTVFMPNEKDSYETFLALCCTPESVEDDDDSENNNPKETEKPLETENPKKTDEPKETEKPKDSPKKLAQPYYKAFVPSAGKNESTNLVAELTDRSDAKGKNTRFVDNLKIDFSSSTESCPESTNTTQLVHKEVPIPNTDEDECSQEIALENALERSESPTDGTNKVLPDRLDAPNMEDKTIPPNHDIQTSKGDSEEDPTTRGSDLSDDSTSRGSELSDEDSSYNDDSLEKQHPKKAHTVGTKIITPTVITMMQKAIDPCRTKVKSTDDISKLAPISKKDKANQCYVNAVYQMLIGMSELWEDIILDASKDSMTNYILTHPFTITGLVMGGLMKGAVEDNSLPKPVKSDVLFSCRKQHLDFKPYSQEDASEYMGQYMDRLIEENKNGNVGRSYKIKSCTRRKCMSCNHEYCGNEVEDNYFNLGIADEFWNKGSCSLQDLINRTFDSTSSLDGFKCPNESCGIQKKNNYSAAVQIIETPLDLVLVIKRYKLQTDKDKASIDVECLETLKVPHWGTDGLKQFETYFLRCIVCHKGKNYNEGHYVSLFVEDKGSEDKAYHEINDDIHWQLKKEQFTTKVQEEGYIFHYSKRISGSLQRNHYKNHLPNDQNLKKLQEKCLTSLRQKTPSRGSKRNRKSNHAFSIDLKDGTINSNDCNISDYFKPMKEALSKEPTCIGTDQHMCVNWNTTCTTCRNTFPSESVTKTITFVGDSEFVKGEDGLFALRDIKKDEYICRYIGKKLTKEKEGEYIVKVNGSLFIDGQNSKCFAKKANHSCQPNCVLQKVSKDLLGDKFAPFGTEEWNTELWIKAVVDISKSQEITYDYGLNFSFDLNKCLCGKCINSQ